MKKAERSSSAALHEYSVTRSTRDKRKHRMNFRHVCPKGTQRPVQRRVRRVLEVGLLTFGLNCQNRLFEWWDVPLDDCPHNM